jgi:hypothetical protein
MREVLGNPGNQFMFISSPKNCLLLRQSLETNETQFGLFSKGGIPLEAW